MAAKLQQRLQQDALRQLRDGNSLIDFTSNDYLGFSSSRDIFDKAHHYLVENNFTRNGSTGSRLISGNHTLYGEAENLIAGFHDAERALIFNSGYDANVGFFSSVPQKGDVILYDEYIHASIRDGIRLSNAAAYKFPHNDIESLAKRLEMLQGRSVGQEVYVVTESVFSMDGDSPDLHKMTQLVKEHNAWLVVDEAHALGVFGDRGEGLVQSLGLHDEVFARIVTFGKGLGCHGAAILGSGQLSEYLVNFSRSFIYTTALPPHALATIYCGYRHLAESRSERDLLESNILHFADQVKELGIDGFIASRSAIHCIIVSGNTRAREVAAAISAKGYDVRPILSPTVPEGKERLRICLHSCNTHEEITGMLEALRLLLQLPSSAVPAV